MQQNRQSFIWIESASQIKRRRESEKHRDGDCTCHHDEKRIPPSPKILCDGNHGYLPGRSTSACPSPHRTESFVFESAYRKARLPASWHIFRRRAGVSPLELTEDAAGDHSSQSLNVLRGFDAINVNDCAIAHLGRRRWVCRLHRLTRFLGPRVRGRLWSMS